MTAALAIVGAVFLALVFAAASIDGPVPGAVMLGLMVTGGASVVLVLVDVIARPGRR